MGCRQSRVIVPQKDGFHPPHLTSQLTKGSLTHTAVDGEESAAVAQWKNTVDGLLQKTHLRNYALSRSSKQLGSLAGLKDFLQRSPAANQLEQVWVIYCWVTHNISYDVYGLKHNKRGPQDAESVFSSGKCVCEGYAGLMQRCCNDLSIMCRKISGYAKGAGYQQGIAFKNQDDMSHAWNAVQVDGDSQWRLVESTWGAGSLSNSDVFEKSFDPYYFFVPPHVFMASHFSENFQLQRRQLTLSEFEQRSALRKLYYLAGLKCITHNVEEGVVNLQQQTATLVFEVQNANDTRYLQARLECTSGGEIAHAVLVQKLGRQYEVSIVLPEVQTVYNVKLFKSIENVDKSDLGHLQVKCVGLKQFGGNENLLCSTFKGSENSYLVSPRRAVLGVLTTERFSIWLQNAGEVVLVDEANSFHHFECSNGDERPPNEGHQLWTLNHFFDMTGKYQLYVKYCSLNSYYNLWLEETFQFRCICCATIQYSIISVSCPWCCSCS